MNIKAVSDHAAQSMTLAVLREVESVVKALRPDTSATAPDYVTGYEAGFRACKRALLGALASD